MRTALFDYRLPKDLIAQRSARPRDMSRLMVLDRSSGRVTAETRFRAIGRFLRPGDLLVVNDTKVFKARLPARLPTGGKAELFLLRPLSGGARSSVWEALARPARKLKPGTVISGKGWHGLIRANKPRGVVEIAFGRSAAGVFRLLAREGHIPVPPYVTREPTRPEEYQTVYAKKVGSVAAPTAGFHLTKPLIASLKKQGVRFASVTLHVGIGTFLPVVADDLAGHRMHAEYAEAPAATVRAIARANATGGRVIVVGTTALRALEGLFPKGVGGRESGGVRKGWVDLFITPGYRFRVADGLVTNFHLPRSTLLVLASAFAGREHVLRAYRRAVREKYRFFSFGDAMLIV